ncbi:bifunctional UDP-N-acetylglucosamine diphosphorylase/glucosamine-1-phosphate N-acetyltransferase GlmU [Smaragdicoccus niigatensis]|uniref:bifunctional UDP-N-acetylglucosamine diphosphorylase/glucosamine-1-phosphate N-acetyltransferase GlmU n=1 Tax=Smaragdicoccus niigatensis TaxID=359359 RepID=UPI0003787783|nr:bifunctional UDP-N-acetylglucosamine diphosphorylase/glucosamine-1-phosphate N-acetyltransferase GlmU [Smaragdicoccus niigatensis]
MSETAVVILAAGAGTRMRSKTAKVLHRVGGRTMLEHTIRAACDLAPGHVVVVVGHQREEVIPVVEQIGEQLGQDLVIAVQDEQLGTGHAAACGLSGLPDGFDGDVLLTAADVPLLNSDVLRELHNAHLATNETAVTILTFRPENPFGYGRITRDASGDVDAIVEQKDLQTGQHEINEVNSGVYAFDAAHLRSATANLNTDNAQGELYLTDVVAIARSEARHVHAVEINTLITAAKTAGAWADANVTGDMCVAGVNDRAQLSAVSRAYNDAIVASHMRAGVTIEDPATTWIEAGVTIGPDTLIYPNVQLRGTTAIGEACEIGPDTTLTNVTVGTAAVVIRTHGTDAELGAGSTIGPFAYLRPGTKLGVKGKIGTFVETKNATIGDNSKVPHLTYVGDATIGEHSNIGASSVFVNYDGITKHHTTVGSHVRTGSDTMFVAPVDVGDGAFSGAGTVIRRNVPPGALAVMAGQQRNIENWVMRYRPDSAAAKAAQAAQEKRAAESAPADE